MYLINPTAFLFGQYVITTKDYSISMTVIDDLKAVEWVELIKTFAGADGPLITPTEVIVISS